MENRFLELETTLKRRKANGHQNGALVSVDKKIGKSLLQMQKSKKPKIVGNGISQPPTTITDLAYLPICGKVVSQNGRPLPETKVFYKDVVNGVSGEQFDVQPLVVRSTTNAKGEFCLAIKLQANSDLENKKVCVALEGRSDIQKLEILPMNQAQERLGELMPGKPLAQILKKLGIPAQEKGRVKYIALGKLIWE